MNFECDSEGECFAKNQSRLSVRNNICTCLKEKPDGEVCPFQKPVREITNGCVYPKNEVTVTNGKDFIEPKRSVTEWADEWDLVTKQYRGRKKCL